MSTLWALVLVVVAGSAANSPATPPGQPERGPGGSDYQHARVVGRSYGKGPTAYWLYEPANPTPKTAPLVVFNHGWLQHVPGAYAAWTDHVVKRGNIVVYPVYQDSLFTAADRFTPNAIRGLQDAIQELQSGAHVRPELDSDVWPALLIFNQAPTPPTAKNFLTIRSDRHGQPALISDHMAACGKWGRRRPQEVDAMDYYGHWRPFDALCEVAFHGRHRSQALGNTPAQRFMGQWSDGVPVRELLVRER